MAAGASGPRPPTAPRSSRPAARSSPPAATTRSACATSSARTALASGTFYNYFPDKEAVFRAIVEEFGAEARRRVRAARRSATGPEDFLESGFRAFFEFIVADPVTFAFLRRNLGTIRERFGDAVLPAGLGELEDDIRGAIDRGDLPGGRRRLPRARDARDRARARPGARRAHPPDVEGATRLRDRAVRRRCRAACPGATLRRHALPPPAPPDRPPLAARAPRRGAGQAHGRHRREQPRHVRRPAVHAARGQARARRRLLERRHGARRRAQPRDRVPGRARRRGRDAAGDLRARARRRDDLQQAQEPQEGAVQAAHGQAVRGGAAQVQGATSRPSATSSRGTRSTTSRSRPTRTRRRPRGSRRSRARSSRAAPSSRPTSSTRPTTCAPSARRSARPRST